MKLLLTCSFLLAVASNAFTVSPRIKTSTSSLNVATSFADEVDFDAPIGRILSAGHAVISPSNQHTIGLGEFGTIAVPDFISRAFLFDENDRSNALYTIGLGDVGTMEIPVTVHSNGDEIPQDAYTIGLGEQGTVSFPSCMKDYFSCESIFTIGLGEYGTLMIGNNYDEDGAVLESLKGHRTIGLGELGIAYIAHEAAKAPVYLFMDLGDMGTTTIKGYLDRSLTNPPQNMKDAYSLGFGSDGTLYFPKTLNDVLDMTNPGQELKGHGTIGLGELGTVQIVHEAAKAPVRYTIGLGDLGTITVDGYLDRSTKNPPVFRKDYSIGLGDQGTLYFPTFLGKALNIAKHGQGVLTLGLGDVGTLKLSQDRSLDNIMCMDDECYLGKHGDATECVDFDPMHEPQLPFQ